MKSNSRKTENWKFSNRSMLILYDASMALKTQTQTLSFRKIIFPSSMCTLDTHSARRLMSNVKIGANSRVGENFQALHNEDDSRMLTSSSRLLSRWNLTASRLCLFHLYSNILGCRSVRGWFCAFFLFSRALFALLQHSILVVVE